MDKLCNNCGKKGHFARVNRQKEYYKRKVRNITKKTTANVGESDESESNIYKVEKINRITDKNKYLTAKVKANGIEKEFLVDTGSPTSILPAENNILKKTEFQNVKHLFQDVNKNEDKVHGHLLIEFEDANNKQKMRILITERDDITPLLGTD